MPKHSADNIETLAVLKIYYEAGDWISNEDYKEKLKSLIGDDQYKSSYTKKGQITSYFGFTTWEDVNKATSRRKITDLGKQFYEALLNDDKEKIVATLITSLKNNSFGRSCVGCSSDSDIEPPQIFIRLCSILGYITKKEFGYILWRMNEYEEDFSKLIAKIKYNREQNYEIDFSEIPNVYTDPKPIVALTNWGVFTKLDEKHDGSEKNVLSNIIIKNHLNDILDLKIYNTSKIVLVDDNDNIGEDYAGINRIYFGPPGTGKSYAIKEFLKNIDKKYYTRVTFHPEYDYSAFVGAYKPISDETGSIKYKFVPQVFIDMYIKAWEQPKNHFYLVIEEINRGNCAEIFGDIFQLLDRNSEYDIEPAHELKTYLEDLKKKNSSIYEEHNINLLFDGKMRMPTNLSILASMNTSDQSLFPMDSAFKRRWEWQYIPINPDCKESDFVIKVSEDKSYNWLSFLKKVNDKIYNVTKSEDKQIGNWFVNPNNKIIETDLFVNKVLFYLWNDVFKDETHHDDNIFLDKAGNVINYNLFFHKEKQKELLIFLFEEVLGVKQ